MKGIILNFRLSKHNKNWNQVIVKVEGIENRKDASKLIGKKVILNIGNKKKIGKVVKVFGNKGKVLVRFRKGLSGEAIMKEVEICE
jgi:large subunit ribosomal protein L35Ae